MSLVASQPPAPIQSQSEPQSKANGHLYDQLIHGKTKSSSNPGSGSTILKDMLASASQMPFGEPIGKNTWAIGSGVREIAPGPRSPKANGNGHVKLPNGHAHKNGNGNANESDEEEDDSQGSPSPSKAGPSSSKLIGPVQPNGTPSRKGKEPAQKVDVTPRKAAGRVLYEDPIDLSWPASMRNRKQAAAGLYNPSMACYANATLQVLLHTPPVLRIAHAHEHKSCKQLAVKGWCMLCAIKKLVAGEHWGSKKAYPPKEVHNHLNLIKKGFSKSRQEDTHEFFRFVTDALQNTALCGLPKDLPAKVKHTTWVYQTWGGQVRSRVVCSRCNKPSDTFDNFLDLSLDMPKSSKSIKSMLQGFIREDKLEGDNKYHCENCKSKANATKSFKILQAPPVLTLHLKRFSVSYSSYGKPRANKNTQFVEYPESLDIAPYMVDSNSTNTKYRLFGVTCHRGTELRFGHYTSYVRGPQGAWFHADDEDMTPVSLSQVLRENTAYLLSYIRVGESDPGSAARPTSTKSSPMPRTNGHAATNGNGNGVSVSAASSPSIKRKRPWAESESEAGTPVSTSRTRLHTPPESSDRDDEEEVQRTPVKWAYGGNKKSELVAPVARNPESLKKSPIDRPSHPGPSQDSPRNRKKDKMRKKSKGAPMPFKHSQSSVSGGGRNKKSGSKHGRSDGRRPFKG